MTDSQPVTEYAVTHDDHKSILNQKETIKRKPLFTDLQIPSTYIFTINDEQTFFLDTLKYDEKICEINKLNPTLVGQRVDDLSTISVKYYIATRSDIRFRYIPHVKGKNVFGYIFDTLNNYINVTHLAQKYTLDFEQWEVENTFLIHEYSQSTGLKYDEMILRGPNTYIFPALCFNFLYKVEPNLAGLMKFMNSALTNSP